MKFEGYSDEVLGSCISGSRFTVTYRIRGTGKEALECARNMCVEQTAHYCAGQSIHTNHVRKAVAGERVIGTARPVHLGKTSHLWEIRVENETGDLISVTRLQLAVLSKKWI